MNKTFFNLSYKISIIIVALFGILLGFLSNAYYVSGFMSFIFYIFRAILFIGVYIGIYLLEKKNNSFKDVVKRMLGYLMICYTLNIVCSLFSITHILEGVFLTISGLVCFWLILVSILEILILYVNNNFLSKVFSVNKKIGLAFANPIIKLLNKNITND